MTVKGTFSANRLLDHFGNAQVDLLQYLGNGSISESGSELNFDAPNSVNCDWNNATVNAPAAYWGLPHDGLVRIETRMSAFARTTNLCLAGIFVGEQTVLEGDAPHTDNGLYYLVYYPNEARLICDRNADTRLYNGPGGDPNTTPHLYRIYINRSDSSHAIEGGNTIAKNSISFWYSVDDGATAFVHLGTRTLEHGPDIFGLFLRKWATGGGDNAQVSFDYLQLDAYVPGERDGDSDGGYFEDRGRIVTSGGPPDHRRHDQLGTGQLVPGPQTQQNDSTGPFPASGYEDQGTLIDAAGRPLHRAPDGLQGGVELGGLSTTEGVPAPPGRSAVVEESAADQVVINPSAGGVAGFDQRHELPGVTVGTRLFNRHGSTVEEILFYDLQLDAGFVLGSYQWGAVTPTGTAPQVTTAVGGGGAGLPGSVVRVTFNEAMRDHPTLGGVLDPRNYDLRHNATSRRLPIIVCRRVSPTQVDLYTEEFPTPHAEEYTITVSNVQNANGDVIGATNNSATFEAAGTGYPVGDELNTFFGLEAGFQSDNTTGVAPDTDAPVLQNQNPAPLDTGVAIDTNIVLEVIDTGAGLDASSVILRVNGVIAWQNDAQQNGFSVTKSPVVSGWEYDIDPPSDLPEGLPVTIGVYARDAAPFPNILDTSYYFTAGFVDVVGPYLTNQNPAAGGEGTIFQDVVFEVRDDKTDIDDSNTTIWINGTPARINGVDQAGFAVTRDVLSLPFPQKGVRYTVNPDTDFLPSTTVTVRVKTQDTGGPPNVIDQTYQWETTPDLDPPELVRLNPASEEEDVQATRGVRFSLIDDFSVVDSTIEIWIRDVVAYRSSTFQPGFTSSVKQANTENGFDFLIVPDADLRWERNERVKVRVVAKDTVPNTLDRTYYFTGELSAEQPFSVYRMIMQSVRDHDAQSPGLLAGICEAFDQVWQETMFDRATELPDLLDPDRIPDKWLPWLKAQVGFTRDLDFDPTEAELRRVIKGGVELWNDKPAEEAIRDAIRLTTGNRFLVRDYFDLRFEVDKARVIEELEDFDPNVLLFSPSAVREVQQLRTCDASSLYPCNSTFYIYDADLPDWNEPKQFTHLLITDHPIAAIRGLYEIDYLIVPSYGTRDGVLKTPFPVQTAQTGPAKLLNVPGDYTTEIRLVDPGVGELRYRALTSGFTIGQRVYGATSGACGILKTATPVPGTATGTFVLTDVCGRFELNEPISDSGGGAAIVDSKLLDTTYGGEFFRVVNRDLLDFLVNQVRPFSERFDVVYVDFIDQFLTPGDLELWTVSDVADVTIPSPGGALVVDPGAWALPKTVIGGEWKDQVATWKVQGPAGAVAHLWFWASDVSVATGSGYRIDVDFTAGTVKLYKVSAGSAVQLGSTVTLPTVVMPDLDLVVRADVLKEGSDTRIRVKVEGNTEIDVADSPASFTQGKLGVSASGAAAIDVKLVEVNTLPTEIQRIGPVA